MAPIGNPKKDSATEGEAAQRRSKIKKGDLVAIALVCESSRYFNKLEKLLIENTVQQLPRLATLAGGRGARSAACCSRIDRLSVAA